MSLNTVKNLKAFLERADMKGQEAYAWVEAHQFVQSMIADLEKPLEPAEKVDAED